MRSWVDICNAALVRVGGSVISDLTEAGEEARKCRALLGEVKNRVLSRHTWSCAMSRASLARAGESGKGDSPRWPYKYAYALPGDCLNALRLETGAPWGSLNSLAANPVPFRTEMYQGKRVLLCDLPAPDLVYVSAVESAGMLTAPLSTAITLLLAAELATSLAESLTLRVQFLQEYEIALQEAMYIDALQGYEVVPPDDSYTQWLNLP